MDFFIGVRYGVHFPRDMRDTVVGALAALPEPYSSLMTEADGKIVNTVRAGTTSICYDDNAEDSPTLDSVYAGQLSIEGASCSVGVPWTSFSPAELCSLETTEPAEEIRRFFSMLVLALRSEDLPVEEIECGWRAICYDNSRHD